MLNHRAVAATVIVTVAAGCSPNGPAPFIAPPPTTTTTPLASPTATPAGTTPTPSPTPASVATASPTPAATATPTALPLVTPSPTPTPAAVLVVALPQSLIFTATGAGAAQTLSVSQSGYSAAFTQVNTCAGIANVSPAATQANAPPPQFTITPVVAGTCAITVSSTTHSVDVAVTVTTSGLIVSGRRNQQ